MFHALSKKVSFLPILILMALTDLALAQSLPPIVVPMSPDAPVRFFNRTLVPNPLSDPNDFFSVHLDKMDFKELKTYKGQELQIDSLVLCENTLATIAGLTRGTDAVSLDRIQHGIDTQDRKEFLELVLEMARQRRHAENQQEWNEIKKTVKGRRADWNAYLFKTDYAVVIVKEEDTEAKYFVPIEEILKGAGDTDIHSAKLAVSKSMSLKVLESFQDTEEYQGADDVKAELAKLSKSLDGICGLENHKFQGEAPLGCFITDLGYLQCAKSDKDLNGADNALLQLRKQIALLQIVRKSFPTLPGLEGLDTLIKRENFQVDCKDRDSLFQGF